ncbi:phosphatase methylesterase 1 protein [Rutstroemia sp. NJR-2017a BBW]|nr:phosphatase methylesterase 1 protein [Rutstroemia sp. NJR-2017a BBW]
MHFSRSLVFAGLVAIAAASPVAEPQSEAQTSKVIEDIQSYMQALATQPAVLAMASSLATDPAVLSTLEAFQKSLQSDIMNGVTPDPAAFTALPSPLPSFYSSIYQAEMSILSKDGFASQIVAASAGASASGSGAASVTGTTAAATGSASASGSGSATAASGTGSKSASASASATGSAAAQASANAAAAGGNGVMVGAGLAMGVIGLVMAL